MTDYDSGISDGEEVYDSENCTCRWCRSPLIYRTNELNFLHNAGIELDHYMASAHQLYQHKYAKIHTEILKHRSENILDFTKDNTAMLKLLDEKLVHEKLKFIDAEISIKISMDLLKQKKAAMRCRHILMPRWNNNWYNYLSEEQRRVRSELFYQKIKVSAATIAADEDARLKACFAACHVDEQQEKMEQQQKIAQPVQNEYGPQPVLDDYLQHIQVQQDEIPQPVQHDHLPVQQGDIPQLLQQNYLPQPVQQDFNPQPVQEHYLPQPVQQDYIPPPVQPNYVPQPEEQDEELQRVQQGYESQPEEQDEEPQILQQGCKPQPQEQDEEPQWVEQHYMPQFVQEDDEPQLAQQEDIPQNNDVQPHKHDLDALGLEHFAENDDNLTYQVDRKDNWTWRAAKWVMPMCMVLCVAYMVKSK